MRETSLRLELPDRDAPGFQEPASLELLTARREVAANLSRMNVIALGCGLWRTATRTSMPIDGQERFGRRFQLMPASSCGADGLLICFAHQRALNGRSGTIIIDPCQNYLHSSYKCTTWDQGWNSVSAANGPKSRNS